MAPAGSELFDLIDQAIIERSRYVILLCFRMIDELERIGHRFLGSSERLWESLAEVFKTALQKPLIIDLFAPCALRFLTELPCPLSPARSAES